MLRFYNNKKDNGMLHILFSMSLIIFMICSFYLADYAIDTFKERKKNDEVIEDFSNIVTTENGTELVDKYASMRDKYPDVIGRIIFYDHSRKLEYLVMQTEAHNKDKYLKADALGNFSKEGTSPPRGHQA